MMKSAPVKNSINGYGELKKVKGRLKGGENNRILDRISVCLELNIRCFKVYFMFLVNFFKNLLIIENRDGLKIKRINIFIIFN